MDSLLGAEILKTRKRWMPYVILLFLIVGTAVLIWLAGYLSWREETDPAFRRDALRIFAFPWSIPALLDAGQFWGAFVVGILAASSVGTEHGWGTVRQAIVRGQSRSKYLAIKLLGVTIMSAVILLIGLAVGVGFSFIASSLADQRITLDVPGGPSVPEIGLMVLRAGFAIVPYGMLAFCLGVLSRSTSLGVTGGLIFLFGEAIALAILTTIGGVAADARELAIGHNVAALLTANGIGEPPDLWVLAPRDRLLASELPNPNIAGFVLALWSFAFGAIAFYVFQHRDLKA